MLLTNPIWLFALAAISIPVVIHLWNIKPGKTLKVGSIALFSESSPKSSRSFKVLDVLLLLLRCLLLILLAVLLAAPLWQQHIKTSKAKGWVLVPEAGFNQIYHQFQPQIDSLTKAGYEFHFFRPDFLKQNLVELLKNKSTTDTLKDKGTVNYWSLINQLSGKVSATVPVELFTTNIINHFTGERPETALHLNWHTYTPADSVNTWLAGAWLKPNGDIRVGQGTATPKGTGIQYNDVKNGGQAGTAYQVGVENGVPVVSLKDSKITVDTAIQRIAIYTDAFGVDANYLKAALDAISQFTQRKAIIKIYNQQDIPGGQDWVFWLSEKQIPEGIIHQNRNSLHYEEGAVTNVNSWISNSGKYNIMQGQAKIPLYKVISSTTDEGTAMWTDGFGNPVLSMGHGKTNVYHFYSRFNPAWNELVWNDNFPKWLLSLVNNTAYQTDSHDRRIISAEQLQPVFTEKPDTVIGAQTRYIDLVHYLWLALAVAFFAERWLAHKNKAEVANG